MYLGGNRRWVPLKIDSFGPALSVRLRETSIS